MESTGRTTLDIQLRSDAAGSVEKAAILRRPFDIEHVFTPRGASYDFLWDGSRAYLAWHDILLTDGEMAGDGFRPVRARDLRRRMTFFPEGMKASGWSAQADRGNSFAALYFDQNWLFEQLETPARHQALRPMIYFHDRTLLASMEKIGRLARAQNAAPRLVLDSVALLTGAELLRAHGGMKRAPGALSAQQSDRAKEYVDAHLVEDVGLADIAAAAGLSTHHFVRAFKQSEGITPYRYLLERRIERAKEMIAAGAFPIAAIGQAVGFKSASHFSRTFTELVGMSPRDYRKGLRR